MNNSILITDILIAPCGMNCGICIGHLRTKNKCDGCNFVSVNKPNHCRKCSIKNCEYLAESSSGFCYDSSKYPCTRLKQLDKRYKANYQMSMIENLNKIKSIGIVEFINQENERWTCQNRNARVSVHRDSCLQCGEKFVRLK